MAFLALVTLTRPLLTSSARGDRVQSVNFKPGHNMTLDKCSVDTGIESNVNVALKGQNAYAFDGKAELASYYDQPLSLVII